MSSLVFQSPKAFFAFPVVLMNAILRTEHIIFAHTPFSVACFEFHWRNSPVYWNCASGIMAGFWKAERSGCGGWSRSGFLGTGEVYHENPWRCNRRDRGREGRRKRGSASLPPSLA